MSVFWEMSIRLPPDEPHFNVTVFGERMPGRVKTLEDAKEAAEYLAAQRLEAALATLGITITG